MKTHFLLFAILGTLLSTLAFATDDCIKKTLRYEGFTTGQTINPPLKVFLELIRLSDKGTDALPYFKAILRTEATTTNGNNMLSNESMTVYSPMRPNVQVYRNRNNQLEERIYWSGQHGGEDCNDYSQQCSWVTLQVKIQRDVVRGFWQANQVAWGGNEMNFKLHRIADGCIRPEHKDN